MSEYVFFRKEGFYSICFESHVLDKTDDEFAYDNALCNPGTIKVEDIFGRKIFPKPLCAI